jgi:hypothetical protein
MSTTVTVACKLPNGLALRNFIMVDVDEPVLGGGLRTVKMAQPVGDVVDIKGCGVVYGGSKPLFGGYALTYNVDAQFFEQWMKDNAEAAFVKNRLIFAHEKSDVVERRAKDNEDAKSGLERIDRNKLPKGIQPADRNSQAA